MEITIPSVVSQNVKNRLSTLLCSQGVIFSEILEHFSSILVKKRGVVGKMTVFVKSSVNNSNRIWITKQGPLARNSKNHPSPKARFRNLFILEFTKFLMLLNFSLSSSSEQPSKPVRLQRHFARESIC